MSTQQFIAVTAVNGQLGSAIVKAAIDLVGGDDVIGLARTPSKAESLGVEIRPGDYEIPAELAVAELAGVWMSTPAILATETVSGLRSFGGDLPW